MKDFMKKKMYLILLVVSFSTLFSAILYADPIYCENDSQCPEGMVCVIPGNYCIEPAIITCDRRPQIWVEVMCYEEIKYVYPQYTFYDCNYTGSMSDRCVMR